MRAACCAVAVACCNRWQQLTCACQCIWCGHCLCSFVTLGGATFNTVSYHKMVHVTVTHSAQVDNGAGSARHRGDMFLSSAFVVLAMLVSTLMCWPSAE